jgi:CrcB protein
MLHVAFVGLGGMVGAIARYGLSAWVQNRWGGAFPAGTLAVNLVGCLLIGALAALVAGRASYLSLDLQRFLIPGILGGLTTFSTFGFETFELFREGSLRLALASIAANMLVGLLAVGLGWWGVRGLVR